MGAAAAVGCTLRSFTQSPLLSLSPSLSLPLNDRLTAEFTLHLRHLTLHGPSKRRRRQNSTQTATHYPGSFLSLTLLLLLSLLLLFLLVQSLLDPSEC